jgi:hypothetical protein
MFQVVLWKTRKEKIYVGDDPVRKKLYGNGVDDYANIEVPYVLPYGTYSYDVAYDKHNRKILKNIIVNGEEDTKVQFAFGEQGGPNVHDGKFVSDCGCVISEYLNLQDVLNDDKNIRKAALKSTVYLERLTPTEATMTAEAKLQFEEFVGKETDKYGYEVPQKPTIAYSDDAESIRTIALVPPLYKLVNHNDRVPQVVKIDSFVEEFEALLIATFRVPQIYIHDRIGGTRGNSHAKIDEERRRLNTAVTQCTQEIISVLQKMFEQIYLKPCVPIRLPAKTLVDIETVFRLHGSGFIDDDVAREEVQGVTGLQTHRMSKGVIKRDKDNDTKKKRHKTSTI